MPYQVSNTFEIFGDPVPETLASEELANERAREVAGIIADWYIKNHEPISEEDADGKLRAGYSSEIDFERRWETVENIDRGALVDDILESAIDIAEVK